MRGLVIFALITGLGWSAYGSDIFRAWQSRRHGSNIFSGNSDADLSAARSYGIKLVRLGATGDQNDFRYLVGADGQWDLSEVNLSRLKNSVHRFGKNGFDVVLTLSHVPGRFWRSGAKDVRIFQNLQFQESFFLAWKTIATALLGENNIAGYDIVNEPLLPEEKGRDTSTIDYAALAQQIEGTPSDINAFYRRALSAIREVDPKTPVILEATGTGDFSSMAVLKASGDPFALYSFHYYEPYAYYRGKEAQGRLKYPGRIPLNGQLWNRDRHLRNLEKVETWRKANGIDAFRVFVGEFGVWPDAVGAETYLKDVTDLVNDYGWSWAHYSFREDAFPHADLELEGHRKARSDTPIFEILRRQFQ